MGKNIMLNDIHSLADFLWRKVSFFCPNSYYLLPKQQKEKKIVYQNKSNLFFAIHSAFKVLTAIQFIIIS